MDSATINETGDSSTTPPKHCHHRRISADSGIDVSGRSNSVESAADSITETYLLQENGAADRAKVAAFSSTSFSQSSDSAIGTLRIISQESDESDFQGYACRCHDSGFSNLDRESHCGPLADFGDGGVSEIKTGVIDMSTDAPSEAHTTYAEHPNHTAAVETCPTATSNCSADSPVEEVDGHETLEIRAIRKFYPDLSNAISQQLVVISTELYSCDLIERAKLDQTVEVSGNSDSTKAVMVLNAALSKMEMVLNAAALSKMEVPDSETDQPSKFLEFIQILKKHGVKETAEGILREYQKQQSSEVHGKYDNTQDLSQQPSFPPNQVNLGQHPMLASTSYPCNESVPYLLTFYSIFAIFLFLVVSLLIVLCWTLNADMKRNSIENMYLCSAFDEKIAIYNEEKQQLKEQLLIAQRQLLQLNRDWVLDQEEPKDHPYTSTCTESKITHEKRIQRLEEGKIDYVAKIENLKVQRDLMLNG